METHNKRKIGLLVALGAMLTALFFLGQALYFPDAYQGGNANTDAEEPSSGLRPDPEPTSSTVEATSSKKGPVRLVIPKINVDAKVQHIGVTKSGNMGVPSNFTDVGWYKYGTMPGNTGSTVIAGHVDNALGVGAVFVNLKELNIGDSVYVENSEGKMLRYKVIDTEIYPYNLRGTELHRIFNDKDGKYLNLITCAGNWLPAARTNDKRLVVFTELVED